jgi:hypothetical protein
MDIPRVGILASGRDLYMVVQTTTSQYQFYIGNINTYEEVARKVHKGIMDAGREARRAASGLQVVEGAQANAVVREAKGRKPGR